MDRDVFAKATRLGREAASALADALDGGPWDESVLARLLDRLFQAAGGVPSFRALASVLDSPLLARTTPERLCDEIDEISTDAGVLDLLLRRAAQREVLAGRSSVRDVCVAFFESVLRRFAVDARGALLDASHERHEGRQHGAAFAAGRESEIRALIRPSAERAADALVARPDARVLGLSRDDRVTVEGNLLPTEVAP